MVGRKFSVLVVLAVFAGALLPASVAGAQNAPRECGGEPVTMVGTPGDDVLIGGPGVDVIAGLQGNDFIDGLAGDDILCGGFGNDVIIGSEGFDIIFGAQGNDEIYSGGQVDIVFPIVLEDVRGARIFAGAGDDIVVGSDRWDRMQGGPGDDYLMGFAGNDWMRGGPGADHMTGHNGSDDLLGGSGPDIVLGDRRDSAVRGGGGQDYCPDIPAATNWRGCEIPLIVNPNDSTIPGTPFPAQLAGGVADTYVYLGSFEGTIDYVGTTNDLYEALADDRFDEIFWVNVVPVTQGQARAIEQSFLEENPQFINQVNSISPNQAYYETAVLWGFDYRGLNGTP